MSDNTSDNNQIPSNKDTFSSITIEELLANILTMERHKLYILPRLFTKDELQELANYNFEVLILRTESGAVYFTIGSESDTHYADVVDVSKLDSPIEMAVHTHPNTLKESTERSLFSQSLPSAGDLTSQGVGAKRNFIFNSFGRVYYIPTRNIGRTDGSDNMGDSISRRIINHTMLESTQHVKEQGIKTAYEAINAIGRYMYDHTDVYFSMKLWEELDPDNLYTVIGNP